MTNMAVSVNVIDQHNFTAKKNLMMATYFVNWTSSNVYGLTLITCDSSLE